MAKTRTLFQRQLLTILIFLLAGMTLAPRIANGQIVPDDTLGKENSTVRQDVIKDVDSDIIEGGATRGANLFHSFTDFNVDVRRGAYFANPDAIDNILSRVTGSNSSSILGTLGVLGDANLFLINPNGIVFGENARLDVGGSFFASTADSLLFDNGFEFSGSDPQAPPLLTVNIPVGLGFRDDPGSITNQSRAVDSNENPVGLQMQSGKDITFAGGDITLDGGKITAPGGRVELGGLAAAGTVELSNDGSLSFPDDIERADLKLSNDASVNVRAAEGGFITVNANNVELVEGSTLLAGIKLRMGSPNAEAGDITINSTGSVSLTNGSQLSIRVRGQGDGGNVIINAKDKVLFDGVGDGSPSAAFSTIREEGEGNAGNIEIITSSLVLTHGSQLSTSTFGQGNAGDVILAVEGAVELVGGDIFSTVEAGAVGEGGNIAINGESLSLSDGAQLQTLVRQADENIPAGKGNAGNINIQVDDAVVISGVGSDGSVSLITSELQTGATGSAGNVNIQASSLSLNGEGNAISSTTSGRGNAGDVILAVEGAVELVGGDIFSTVEAGAVGAGGNIKINGQSLFLTDDAQLQTLVRGAKGTTLAGKGNAGNINIQIGSLSLNGETNKIISSTFGQGDAGDVTIEAEGAVELVGGEISSNVESRAEGNGGEIDITANHLSLTKKAKLNTSTSGQGDAGKVTIEAEGAVELVGGEISSNVESRAEGNGGEIDITANHLSLTKKAKLNTSTAGQGNAGKVTIEAEGAVELVEGEISSNVGNFDAIFSSLGNEAEGSAGDISITADSLTLEEGGFLSNSTSGQGNAGNIIINAADTVFFDNASTAQSRVEEGGVGNGGNINIQTRTLSLANGSEILADTFGEGRAGNIQVDASDSVILSGVAPLPDIDGGSEGGFSSGLITATEEDAQGQGGEISVTTDRLQIEDGAVLSARSRSNFSGGNIKVKANTLEVTGGGQILTTAFRNGDAGEINLNISDRIAFSGSDPTYNERFNQVVNRFDREQAELTIDPVSPESGLFANTAPRSIGAGGKVTIDTGQLLVSDGAQISASTSGAGKGGNLTILARQGVEFRGTGLENFDDAIKRALETGGNIESLQEFIQDEAPLSTATFSTGEAGTITINTPDLVLKDGAILSSTTFGGENAGGIFIKNAKSVELIGSGLVAGTFNPNAEEAAVGGNIDIVTGKLSLQEGGRILTTTFSEGKGGNVEVTASESVELGSTPSGVILPTTINASSVFGTGSAGDVTIETPKLIVRDGAQIVTTSGSDSLTPKITEGGQGGDIEVRDSESLEISGISPDGRFKSALTAESFSDSRAGDLSIETGQMKVADGAEVTVSNRQGQAGNLGIAADSLSLDRGSITAKTGKSEAEEEGANITLQISDLLTLSNESPISAEAFDTANGGNIDIDADFIVAFPRDNEIIANAFEGKGGNIDITTNFIFGLPNFLELDASSELGLSGTVEISDPEVEPDRGLIELPEDVVDPAALIAQNPCTLGLDSEFIITGRGGLPPSPNQVLSSDSARVGWVEPAPVESRGASERTSIPNPQSKIQDPIVPARGWVLNDKGETILVGYDPTNSGPQRSRPSPPACPAP